MPKKLTSLNWSEVERVEVKVRKVVLGPACSILNTFTGANGSDSTCTKRELTASKTRVYIIEFVHWLYMSFEILVYMRLKILIIILLESHSIL